MYEDIIGRLENWKFSQALTAFRKVKLEGDELHNLLRIVEALSSVFGNPGWFDGDMGIIVQTTVDYVIEELKK